MTRRAAFSAALVLLVAFLPATTQSAEAVNCAGDSYADGTYWSDNYWVGYGCDLNGDYTVGIQWINWGHGYRQSGIDGYFGSKTYNDVRSFQGAHGLDDDGLVGPNTWGKYDDHLILCAYIWPTKDWRTPGWGCESPIFTTNHITWTVHVQKVSNGDWVRFSRYGPS